MSRVIDLGAYLETSLARTLVLLDVQRDCPAAPGLSAALDNCRTALRHARAAGLQIAFTRWIGRAAFFGTAAPPAGWLDGLAPTRNDLVFDRNAPSCYSNPLFAEVIGQGGGHFILAGISGETAGLATSVDAFHRDHRLTYLSDASASQGLGEFGSGAVHRVVTQVIGRFGETMTTRAWITATARRKNG